MTHCGLAKIKTWWRNREDNPLQIGITDLGLETKKLGSQETKKDIYQGQRRIYQGRKGVGGESVGQFGEGIM